MLEPINNFALDEKYLITFSWTDNSDVTSELT